MAQCCQQLTDDGLFIALGVNLFAQLEGHIARRLRWSVIRASDLCEIPFKTPGATLSLTLSKTQLVHDWLLAIKENKSR